MATIGTDIEEARRLLRSGEVVGIPTETVYGLAGNAFNARAVARIFEVKDRPSFDPLIVHAHSIERIARFVEQIPAPARKLAGRFWPGALTLLLPKKPVVPDLVTSGLDTVAVRMPRHPLTRQLLESLDFPLAAPSANPFGYISPTRAEHVQAQLGHKLAYILDGGPCEVGIESTIVGFMDGVPVVYRLGGISTEAIEAVVGRVEVMPHSASNPLAPGMLKSHYAPRKPLTTGTRADAAASHPEKTGFLGFDAPAPGVPPGNQVLLSPSADLAEAAQRLFAALRWLDSLPHLDRIVAELLPETGLGRAINDRIRRAAAS